MATGFRSAAVIGKALGGRRVGDGWMACCPAHEDHTPSLSIRDGDGGKVLVRCHAGCNQQAVITAVRARGLWPESGRRPFSCTASRDHNEYQPDQDDAKRRDAALAIWQS